MSAALAASSSCSPRRFTRTDDEHAGCKTHQRREVPIPRFLAAELAGHIAGRNPDDLVFAGIRNGHPLRVSTFRTTFSAAARTIGVPDLYPHQLRHTAASLAIASGADVKVVQQMLGHASAAMTSDTYGHLFEDRLDEVGDALDRARGTAVSAESCCPVLPQRCPSPILTEMRKRSVPGLPLVRTAVFGVVPPTGFEPALPP
jgi:Phage integrase family